MTGVAGLSRFCGKLWLVLAASSLFVLPAAAQNTDPGIERVFSTAEFWTASGVVWLIGGVALAGLAASFGWRFHSVARLNRQLTDQTAISRLVLDNVDQGFTLFDADLTLVAFNERFIELRGFPPEMTRGGDF